VADRAEPYRIWRELRKLYNGLVVDLKQYFERYGVENVSLSCALACVEEKRAIQNNDNKNDNVRDLRF
jgi:hypothetical protein